MVRLSTLRILGRSCFPHNCAVKIAEPLVNRFVELLREHGIQRVETGIFRAMMQVEIHNDGPVTIILERDAGEKEGL